MHTFTYLKDRVLLPKEKLYTVAQKEVVIQRVPFLPVAASMPFKKNSYTHYSEILSLSSHRYRYPKVELIILLKNYTKKKSSAVVAGEPYRGKKADIHDNGGNHIGSR